MLQSDVEDLTSLFSKLSTQSFDCKMEELLIIMIENSKMQQQIQAAVLEEQRRANDP